MIQEKKLQCTTCRHNIKTTSCGSCADKGSQMVENIAKELGVEVNSSEEDTFRQNCKIVMQYPEDYDAVDPYKCKYYMSSFYSFR